MLPTTDTICAIATSPGVGAIAVLRLSGVDAVKIANQIFSKSFETILPNTVHFGKVSNNKNEVIDEVVLSYFKAPNSYTGEDVVEISCHGSLFIQNQILETMITEGARIAEPGEFTQRAFLNRKLDLSQAEAVADLIAAESKASHQLAFKQMRGGYSSEIEELRQQLINFASLLELELDFGEEDVEFADRKELFELIDNILHKITPLIDSFKYGNAIKNGVQTVIAGRPNAGKSTLLNTLLKEERAIVSEIAGTTRDVIEEVISIKGTVFRLIDTAGIREATDTIEAIGVKKAIEKAKSSAILVFLFDMEAGGIEEVKADLEQIATESMNIVLCGTKSDLISAEEKENWITAIKPIQEKYCCAPFYGVSATKGVNVDLLLNELYEIAVQKIPESSIIITNARHHEALSNAKQELEKAKDNMQANVSSDFVAMDIRSALHYLGLITGAIDVDADILGTIFGKFCIGK